jgi:hypothetical protein
MAPLLTVLAGMAAGVPSGLAVSLTPVGNSTGGLVLSLYGTNSSDPQPTCLLERGTVLTSQVAECGECMWTNFASNSVLTCNETMGDTWAYGCDDGCGNCTETILVSPGDCMELTVPTPGTPGMSVDRLTATFNAQVPEPAALYCSSSAPADSVFYVKLYEGLATPDDCTKELEPGTVEQAVILDDLSGNCVSGWSNTFYRMQRGLNTENETDFDGVLGCTDSACEAGCTNVTGWILGKCEALGGPGEAVVIGDCRAGPGGDPESSNAVPMELLAVGILVLVLAGFFIAQACHRATKKKFGAAGSLNADTQENSSLLSTSLARDNTGRVSYSAMGGGGSTTNIVRAEAAMRSGRQADNTKVPPIVAAEQVAAAVRAEKQERERMSEIKAPVPLKMKTIKL